MTMIDDLQDYLIEIVGTIVFIVGSAVVLNSAIEFFPALSGGFFLGAGIIVVGLILMGYKKMAEAISDMV